ncbi:MAG: hypothetical protein IJJ00_07915 [Erysipelotrichaceae bacterium]|nr:hypothetical protein [Erysipelotrichaceae bacterium]
MKKLLLLLLIVIISGCAAKREDFYSLSFDGNDIAVGYDGTEMLDGVSGIDNYAYYLNDKEEKIISRLVIYLDDLNDPLVYIDDYPLNKGIKESCADLDGELIEKNGYACFIGKEVYKRENYIILYGDILDDDIDEIDRIEAYYDDNGR